MSVNTRINLVVTGDDFGYCPHRDVGIVECFNSGAITNVSLLVNGFNAACAADLARRYNIPIGLHANLSEGIPVCKELHQNSTLVNAHGFFLGKMGIRKALAQGLLSMSEVQQELSAQVKQFRELTGQNPQHMDGHQHVHVLPKIRNEFAQVLREHSIPFTRVPIEIGLHRCNWIKGELMEFYKSVEEDSLNSMDVFVNHGIRWPDAYFGLGTMGQNMTIKNIQQALDYSIQKFLREQCSLHCPTSSFSIELMTHPGYPSTSEGGCGQGPDDFSQSWERLHEMKILKDPLLHSYYRALGIHLCAFKDL